MILLLPSTGSKESVDDDDDDPLVVVVVFVVVLEQVHAFGFFRTLSYDHQNLGAAVAGTSCPYLGCYTFILCLQLELYKYGTQYMIYSID
mmetsp:Transcript_23773/g.56140  ORF Transcript_23773/g.56140 Transcript_23773/m.56140 type:complete len:90 (+) Transcript_23773:3727-3996(+)